MMVRSLIMLLVVAMLLHLSSSRPIETKSELDTGGPKDFVASKDVEFPGGGGVAAAYGVVPVVPEEDVDMMPFPISWSRIFPDGTGRVNQKGVDRYKRMIDYMIDVGIITPCVKLYHYYPPLALEKKYKGLLSRQFVNDFADYADFCFKTFGDRVKNWMTLDEPGKVAAPPYVDDPERCSNAYGNCSTDSMLGPEPFTVAHHLILAHAAAVQRYRQKYQETQKGRIGILLDFVVDDYVPPRTRSKAAVNYTAQRAWDSQLGWFLHPIVYGEYPRSMQDRLPKFTAEEVKMVKGSSDFIGINQQTTSYYKYDPNQEQQQPKDFSYQKSSS